MAPARRPWPGPGSPGGRTQRRARGVPRRQPDHPPARGVTLFGVVRRTLSPPALRSAFGAPRRGSRWPSRSCGSCIRCTTAAVTYVVQRVESLMALFYLLTLYCAIRASGDRARGVVDAAAVVQLRVRMATKEVMVTAPLVVAAVGRLFGRPRCRAARGARWRLLAGLVGDVGRAGAARRHANGAGLRSAWRGRRLVVPAGAGRGRRALPAAGLRPVAAGVLYDWPLGTSLGAVAWQAVLLTALVVLTAMGVAAAPSREVPGRVVLPDPRALVQRPADRHRGRRRTPDVPAAGGHRAGCGGVPAGRRVMPSPKAGVASAAVVLAGCAGVLAAGTRQRNRATGARRALGRYGREAAQTHGRGSRTAKRWRTRAPRRGRGPVAGRGSLAPDDP